MGDDLKTVLCVRGSSSTSRSEKALERNVPFEAERYNDQNASNPHTLPSDGMKSPSGSHIQNITSDVVSSDIRNNPGERSSRKQTPRTHEVPTIQVDFYDDDEEDEEEQSPPPLSADDKRLTRKTGVYHKPHFDDNHFDNAEVSRSVNFFDDADIDDDDDNDDDVRNNENHERRGKGGKTAPSASKREERTPATVTPDHRVKDGGFVMDSGIDSEETGNLSRKMQSGRDVSHGSGVPTGKDFNPDDSDSSSLHSTKATSSKPTLRPVQETKTTRKISFEVNDDDEGSEKVRFSPCSTRRPSMHPAYEKKLMVSAMKGGRKISQESYSQQHKLPMTGAGRRISVHQRKISGGSEGGGSLGANMVPSRKGSMVMIEKIPQIIKESLQSYLEQVSDPAFAMQENEEEDDDEDSDDVMKYRTSRMPRMSIFSTWSYGSNQSDATFYDPEESLPKLDHYGYVQAMPDMSGYRARPTLYQLREEPEAPLRSPADLGRDLEDADVEEGKGEEKKAKEAPVSQKMGWIQGVLVRCLLNIFGVMLFLRLTWMTGQAGIVLASVIVLISSLVTTLTTMSMAAICTNGEVKGGGAYYMISRSLGPEFGGAIGVIFSLANAVAASMHAVGFAETMRDLLYKYDIAITGDLLHDVRVIASGTMVLLLIIVLIGLDFESKAQLVLLVILIVSLFNYFIGTFLPPSEEKRRVGFVGYHGSVFLQNVGPDFREADGTDYDFFKIFAIYFPSATGILAGANISGDLKNPSKAIPRGTFLAILITTIVYLAIVWSCGSCMVRDAVGAAVANASNMSLTLEDIQTCGNVSCSFGLQNSHAIMGVASAYGPLIYAGAFSATLSSSLACLVSAPKVFQALAKDKLFPFIGIFGKGYGKGGEPRPGYILTFVICVGMSCIGSLDIIAPIISNFFLMAYALINFSCFDAAFANSPGFRPSFHFFNKWLSLLGALICLVIMFLLKWWAALATVIMVSGLYVFLVRRKPDVNWGSSAQAHAYNDALKSTLSLMNVNEHVKNFRPQILALTGYPRNRPGLVDFTSCITKRQSLLVCGHVFVGDMQRHVRHLRSTAAYRWFSNRDVRAFYSSLAAPTIRHGVQVLLQSQGLGKLRPNTLLMGFKTNWQTAEPRSVHNYVGIIHDAFDLHYGVGILRVPGGLDTHKVSDDLLDATDDTLEGLDEDNVSMEEGADFSEDDDAEESSKDKDKTSGGLTEPSGNDVSLKTFKHSPGQGHVNNGYIDDLVNDSSDNDDHASRDRQNDDASDGDSGKKAKRKDKRGDKDADGTARNDGDEARDPRPAQSSALSKCESSDDAPSFNRFRGKQQGTIDVWWLFDDGGLGLLVPYLLSTRKQWKNCKLRVFCAGTKRSNIDADHRQMATLLNKLRIDCSEITVVPDLRTKPKRSSYKEFEEVIYQWRLKGGEFQDDYPWKVSDADLASHKEKIYMQIKIREKLLEFSKDASLIVVTLPVPRKFCPSGLYMAWLDTLSRDLPPTLLLRGNQQSVLTFTS